MTETIRRKKVRLKALATLLLLGALSYCSAGTVSELDEQEIIQKVGQSIISEIKKDYYDQQKELYETARGDGVVASKARKEYERRYWLIDALKIEHIEAKRIPTDNSNTVENQDDYIIKVMYSMDNKTPFDGKNKRFMNCMHLTIRRNGLSVVQPEPFDMNHSTLYTSPCIRDIAT